MHLIVAISQIEKLVGFALEDDTDLCIYGPHITSHNVCNAMQNLVDHWEGLLRVTGGTLVPTKCFWHLIDFKFTNKTWTYITKHQKLGELAIKDGMHHWIEAPRLETHEVCQTWGYI